MHNIHLSAIILTSTSDAKITFVSIITITESVSWKSVIHYCLPVTDKMSNDSTGANLEMKWGKQNPQRLHSGEEYE